MKKLLTLTLSITLLSLPVGCEVDEPNDPCNPNCGIVERRGFASNDDIGYYAIYVKNECTHRIQKFRVSKVVYYSYDKGDQICSVDGKTWIPKN